MRKIFTLSLLLSFTVLTAQNFNKKEAKENNTNTTTLNRLPPDEGISDNNGDFIELEPLDGEGEIILPTDPIFFSLPPGRGEVGYTKGDLSVSKTGGAVYNIPIEVPPGINGVEPKISLNYNSQAGNGILGYAWNILGVSQITRIGSDKYYDDYIDPVDFDEFDRFSFNGQRLILKSGIYGQQGSIYETENFSNLKIFLLSNNGLNYFKIEYPNGNVEEYGKSIESNNEIAYNISSFTTPQGLIN